jgi:hypothetical protein
MLDYRKKLDGPNFLSINLDYLQLISQVYSFESFNSFVPNPVSGKLILLVNRSELDFLKKTEFEKGFLKILIFIFLLCF